MKCGNSSGFAFCDSRFRTNARNRKMLRTGKVACGLKYGRRQAIELFVSVKARNFRFMFRSLDEIVDAARTCGGARIAVAAGHYPDAIAALEEWGGKRPAGG